MNLYYFKTFLIFNFKLLKPHFLFRESLFINFILTFHAKAYLILFYIPLGNPLVWSFRFVFAYSFHTIWLHFNKSFEFHVESTPLLFSFPKITKLIKLFLTP